MSSKISIRDLSEQSGVRFGTSGARGLVTAMTDQVCYAYTAAFLQALEARGEIAPGGRVGVAGDRRPSSPRIMRAAAKAARDRGYQVVSAGLAPSPAIALYGLTEAIPTLMVTGSHIPDDRNGIKFTKLSGEILKPDEIAILAQELEVPEHFDAEGMLLPEQVGAELTTEPEVSRRYVARWLEAFPKAMLSGKKIVVYGHSAVGRDLLVEVLSGLGAEVIKEAWSERFVPVDTEAIRSEDVVLAKEFAAKHQPYAIVSTDGDADRPLVSDGQGRWLRGDVAGVLTASFFGADAVVTPVSSNTVLELSGVFAEVGRTRIGSPFVIERMQEAVAGGRARVAGYEANGGFLMATSFAVPGGALLSPLPTRDPIVVILGVLGAALARGGTVSELVGSLPSRHTASDRLQNFPVEQARGRLAELSAGGVPAFTALTAGVSSPIATVDYTDGVRGTSESGEIVHLRGSGNAPELRCYAEADTAERASELVALMLTRLGGWR